MQELWGMRSIPSLPSLLGPLWPSVVAPGRVLSMGQINSEIDFQFRRKSYLDWFGMGETCILKKKLLFGNY